MSQIKPLPLAQDIETKVVLKKLDRAHQALVAPGRAIMKQNLRKQYVYSINTSNVTCYQISTFVTTLVNICARNSRFIDMNAAEGKQHE